MTKSFNKIKICHVIEPLLGGAPKHVSLLLQGLSPEKFDLILICPSVEKSPYFSNLPQSVTVREIYMGHEISLWADFISFLKLVLFLIKEKPQIVHAHSSKAGVLARWAAKCASVRNIYYTPHGFSFLRTDVTVVMRRVFVLLEKVSSYVTDRVVCVSDSEAEEAKKVIRSEAIFVNPNGVPIPKDVLTSLKREDKPLRVATLGRLTPAKGMDLFLEVAQEVYHTHPQVHFLWIGGPEKKEQHLGEIFLQKGQNNVKLTGWLSPNEAQSVLKEIDIFIMTSHWEGLPFALIEAMAMGKPAVVVHRAGLAAVVQDEVCGFVGKDAKELSKGIVRLIESSDKRFQMGDEARKVVRTQYSYGKMLNRISSLYEKSVSLSQ